MVTCPEGGPVFPWVCVPDLPVWGESFQTFINSLKCVCKVLGCCGVSLGVSPLQGWLGPGRSDEPELELLFVTGVCATFNTGFRAEAQTHCRAVSDPRDSWNVTTGICFSQGCSGCRDVGNVCTGSRERETKCRGEQRELLEEAVAAGWELQAMRPPLLRVSPVTLCFLISGHVFPFLCTALPFPLHSSSLSSTQLFPSSADLFPSSAEPILPGEVGELRGNSSPAPGGDPEGVMALTDPFKDKLGSHKLWGGVWEVQASLNSLFGGVWGGSDSGLEIPAGSVCTVRLVLSRSLFLFPEIIYSRNQMLEVGKDLVEIGKDFLAPCSALAPPHCDCFRPVWCLAWLEVEAGTDVFVVLRSCSGGGGVPPRLCWCHQWHLAEDTGVTYRTGFCLEQRLPSAHPRLLQECDAAAAAGSAPQLCSQPSDCTITAG